MSLHRSLTVSSRGRRHRNVLSREERIAKLEDEGRWDETRSIFGLPKVRSIKAVVGGKKKKKKEEEKPAEGAPVEGEAEGEAAEGGAAEGKDGAAR